MPVESWCQRFATARMECMLRRDTYNWMPLKKEPKRPIIPRNSTRLRFFTMNSSHTLEMPYSVAPARTSRSPSSLWSPVE